MFCLEKIFRVKMNFYYYCCLKYIIQKIKGSDKRHGGNTFKAHSHSMFTSDGRRNTAVKIALFKKKTIVQAGTRFKANNKIDITKWLFHNFFFYTYNTPPSKRRFTATLKCIFFHEFALCTLADCRT